MILQYVTILVAVATKEERTLVTYWFEEGCQIGDFVLWPLYFTQRFDGFSLST